MTAAAMDKQPLVHHPAHQHAGGPSQAAKLLSALFYGGSSLGASVRPPARPPVRLSVLAASAPQPIPINQ